MTWMFWYVLFTKINIFIGLYLNNYKKLWRRQEFEKIFSPHCYVFLAIVRDFMQRKTHRKKCDAEKQHLKIYKLNITYYGKKKA